MILVVEGISAAGKTSWCNRHANGHVVPEAAATGPAPDRDADPVANAGFWVDQAMRRWSLASELARQTGLAVCDTDPLKLHFHWSLWRIGVLPDIHWRLETELAREAVRTGRLGFADLYLVKTIDPKAARRQREADTNRTRRNFDLHVRLGPPLAEWYQALEQLLPGCVLWALPERVPNAWPREREEDLFVFDRLVSAVS